MALYSFFGLVLYDVWDDDWEEGNIWISVLTGSGIHTCGHTDGERKKKWLHGSDDRSTLGGSEY